jgi:hypothetical protein
MKSGACLLICLVFIIACCASGLKPLDTNMEKTWLSFIKDGKTTKEEIIITYGSPMKTFTNENILIYSMWFAETRGQGFIKQERRNTVGEYHFVFVFDENNILKRHSFLKVR